MAASESRRLRRASRGRDEAEEEGRRTAGDAQEGLEDEEATEPGDSRGRDSGGGVFSELKDVVSEAALGVLAPVAKEATTKAAEVAMKKGPQLFEEKVLPKLDEAGGPMGLVQGLSGDGNPVGNLLSKVTGGGDDDDGGGKGGGDGTGKGRRMPIQQSVDVAAPIDVVYDQFTQFED